MLLHAATWSSQIKSRARVMDQLFNAYEVEAIDRWYADSPLELKH